MGNDNNTIGHGTWGGMIYDYTLGHEPKKLRDGDNYVLVFDNNETFTYPKQESFVPITKESKILGTGKTVTSTTSTTYVQPKLEYYDPPTNTTIFGIKSPVPRRKINVTATTNLKYEAGDAVAHVNAYDTNGCTFDVGANESSFFGDVVRFHGGQDNHFIGDEKDDYIDEKGYIYKHRYDQ